MIKNILNVDDHNGQLKAKLEIDLEWFDTWLTYKDLNKKIYMKKNTLSIEEQNTIWKPELVFLNTESKDMIMTCTEQQVILF